MGIVASIKNAFSKSKPKKSNSIIPFNQFIRNLRASYDSASTNDLNSKHWSYSDGLSADSALSSSVRKKIRERARYETENNTYAKGMLNTLSDNVIGIGPRLQLLTPDSKFNSTVELAFTEWMRAVSLADKLRLMQKTRVRDGEVFFVYQQNPKIDNAIKTELILIECDRVTDPEFNLESENDIDGVFIDDFGNPVKYRILKHHPGSNIFSMGIEYNDFKAENIIHHFKTERPEQHRGLSEISSALPLYALLRRLTLATIYAAENAAEHAGVLSTPMPAESDPSDVDSDSGMAGLPFETVGVEYNGLTIMPDGYTLQQYKAEHPNSRYSEFKREILNEISRCLSIPRNVAQGDSSGYNYASGRLDHQVYFKKIRVEQDWIGRTVLDRILSNWHWEYSTMNGFSVKQPIPHQWFWDGSEHVDPLKEAKAQETRLNSRTTTYAAEFAKQGQDWEEQFEQVAREKTKMQELGITPVDLNNKQEPEEDDDEEK